MSRFTCTQHELSDDFRLERIVEDRVIDRQQLTPSELEDLLRTISAALGVASRTPSPAPQPWPPPDDVEQVLGWDPDAGEWDGFPRSSEGRWASDLYTHWIPALPAPEDWPQPLKGDALDEAAEAITWACDGDPEPLDPDAVAEGLADRIAGLEEKVTAPSKTSIALLEDLDRRLRKVEGGLSETQRRMATGMRQLDTRIDDVGNRLDHMPAPAEPYLSGEYEIELMGYGRTCGQVTQQHPAGLVAVERDGETTYYGAGAIYRMTPLVVSEPRRCPGETFADRGVTPAEVVAFANSLKFERQLDGWWVYADGDHVFPTAKSSLVAAVSAMVASGVQAVGLGWSADGWLSFVKKTEGWIAKRDGEPLFDDGFPTLTEAIRAAADDIPF